MQLGEEEEGADSWMLTRTPLHPLWPQFPCLH